MSLFPEPLERLAAEVIAAYGARGLMVATAESCTGGLIAGLLTDVAGSSKVVDRGFVTYSNQAKQELIGVREETLARYGAVSRETALEMAAGALAASQAFAAVAVTGIAGPGGGSAEKPVGLVHLAAVSRPGEVVHSEMRYGDIGRTGVRLATIETALAILSKLVIKS